MDTGSPASGGESNAEVSGKVSEPSLEGKGRDTRGDDVSGKVSEPLPVKYRGRCRALPLWDEGNGRDTRGDTDRHIHTQTRRTRDKHISKLCNKASINATKRTYE